MRRPWKWAITIVVLLVAVGGVAGWYYLGTRGGALARAELAMRASKFDKALQLASQYVEEHPDQWQGYYTQARVHVAAGRFAEARGPLGEAGRMAPGEVEIPLLLAETYAAPARRALVGADLAARQRAAADMAEARNVLLAVETDDPAKRLDVRERLGTLELVRADLHHEIARELEAQALAAEAQGQPEVRDERRGAAGQSEVESLEARAAAQAALLEVVQADPRRADAAEALIAVCRDRGDREALAAAREAILSVEDPPPGPAVQLVLAELDPADEFAGQGVDPAKLAEVTGMIDAIAQRHPDDVEVKLAKASLAIQGGDLDGAERLVGEILAARGTHGGARLLQAQLRERRGDLLEAERLLAGLRTDAPGWPNVQYAYARVALRLGRRDAAREALDAFARAASGSRAQLLQAQLALDLGDIRQARQLAEQVLASEPAVSAGLQAQAMLVRADCARQRGDLAEADRQYAAIRAAAPQWITPHLSHVRVLVELGRTGEAIEALRAVLAIDPDHDLARQGLAELQLGGDDPEHAFAAAQAAYEASPGDPGALQVFVRAAIAANRAEAARQALAQAETSASPMVLLVAANGYEALADAARSRAMLERVAAARPVTPAETRAVVQALRALDRVPEAERLLADLLAASPARADAHAMLGDLYRGSNRPLPALDRYRDAVRLEPGNVDYRLALAEALFEGGDLDEARRTLEPIDPGHPDAALLRMRMQIARGEPVDLAQLRMDGSDRRPAAVAMAMLARREFQRCAELLEPLVHRTPDDAGLRMLLGQAYFGLGQRDRAVEQWQAMLAIQPTDPSPYRQLAAALGEGRSADETVEQLAQVPGAREDLVGLTHGVLLLTAGEPARAADVLATVAADEQALDPVRAQARLLQARALATAGQTDAALAAVEPLEAQPQWQDDALQARLEILAQAGRRDEAMAALGRLQAVAVETRDAGRLRSVVAAYLQLRQIESALAGCDALLQLAPDDPRTHLARGDTLRLAGRMDDAIAAYRKALELQPGNEGIHVALAGALDAAQRPLEALAVLQELERTGSAGAVVSLFQQGQILQGWGLNAQAIDRFTRAAGLGYGGNTEVQIQLGEALARVGERQRARDVLQRIPPYDRNYRLARQYLAELAQTPEERLTVVRQLAQAEPGVPEVLVQEMLVLRSMDRQAEAAEAFDRFAQAYPDRIAPQAAMLATACLLEAQDLAGAQRLATAMSAASGDPNWRVLAILLSAQADPAAALAMMPAPQAASFQDAVLGAALNLHVGDAQAAQTWRARMEESQRTGTSRVQPGWAAMYAWLLTLATDPTDPNLAGQVPSVPNYGTEPAQELLTHAEADAADARAEALVAVRTFVAMEVGVPQLAHAWAMQQLNARPASAWAAAVALTSLPEGRDPAPVLQAAHPTDEQFRQRFEAMARMQQGAFAEAAALLAAAYPSDPPLEVTLQRAMALEQVGELADALDLYLAVWRQSQDPRAANNAAYVILQVHPADAAKLEEAAGLARQAAERRPDLPSFQDTLGWIAFRQGRYEDACVALRKAVRGLPDEPEVHYHLGLAESAAGRADLARWHLQAAVDLGRGIQAGQGMLPPGAADAVRAAEAALRRLGPMQ